MTGALHSPQYRQLLAKLRKARTAAGLTQAEVARRLGKHQSFISKCENGERRLDIFELTELASVYQTSIRDLLEPR